MLILYGLMALCLSGGAVGVEIHGVEYPKIESMNGFELAKMIGKWYHQVEAEITGKREGYGCLSGSFQDWGHPEDEGLTMIWTYIEPGTDRVHPMKVYMHVPDPDQPAKLFMKLDSNFEADFMILGTDYVSYLVMLMSVESKPKSFAIQVWTRDQKPVDNVLIEPYKLFTKMGYNSTNLEKMRIVCLKTKSG